MACPESRVMPARHFLQFDVILNLVLQIKLVAVCIKVQLRDVVNELNHKDNVRSAGLGPA